MLNLVALCLFYRFKPRGRGSALREMNAFSISKRYLWSTVRDTNRGWETCGITRNPEANLQLFKFSIFFQMRDYWQKSYNIDVNSPVIGVIDPKLVCHFCVISCNPAQKLPSFWLPLAVWGRYILMLNLNEIFFITEIRTLTQEIL